MHGLRPPGEEIVFTARPKTHSHSQIFRYCRSIFCLAHRPKFSDFFDFCLHWVSVVRALEYGIWIRCFMIQKAKYFIFSDKSLGPPTTVVYHESILPLPFLICSWDQRTTFIFVKGLLDWPLHNGACWNEAFSAICGNAAEALLKPQCRVWRNIKLICILYTFENLHISISNILYLETPPLTNHTKN